MDVEDFFVRDRELTSGKNLAERKSLGEIDRACQTQAPATDVAQWKLGEKHTLLILLAEHSAAPGACHGRIDAEEVAALQAQEFLRHWGHKSLGNCRGGSAAGA